MQARSLCQKPFLDQRATKAQLVHKGHRGCLEETACQDRSDHKVREAQKAKKVTKVTPEEMDCLELKATPEETAFQDKLAHRDHKGLSDHKAQKATKETEDPKVTQAERRLPNSCLST